MWKSALFTIFLIIKQIIGATEDLNTTTITGSSNTLKQFLDNVYCAPSLCELFNGTHLVQVPHIGCNNDENFGTNCGRSPQLLYMSERRRNFILDMHNLARSHIASGNLKGYAPAVHMPIIKWDEELASLATLHVKRCRFAHDQCRNSPQYPFSGQNIGYFWIGRKFKSHTKRIKTFIINWFREYVDANQTFINNYRPHPNGKKIGHFTLLVADRVHRVGCAAVSFNEPKIKGLETMYKFMMTCNYDYNNIFNEPIYQIGEPASKCALRKSDKFPALCDWRNSVYDYVREENVDDGNQLGNNIQ